MTQVQSSDEVRKEVIKAQADRCCMCSAHIGFNTEVVAIQPLSEGGAYSTGNLVVLCPFCRWLVQRNRVSQTALKNFKKAWESEAAKAKDTFSEDGLTIVGDPLRLEAKHRRTETILEGSELDLLLGNFFNCLDTFLIHEDQHLENAVSLAVIRAFRDMYNYVPPEKEIKELTSPDSRKLDLLYRGVRSLLAAGLSSKARRSGSGSSKSKKSKSSARKSGGKKATKKSAKKAGKKSAKKKSAKKKATKKKPARESSKKKAATKKSAKKKSAGKKRVAKK